MKEHSIPESSNVDMISNNGGIPELPTLWTLFSATAMVDD
jgi:hypothetical protein